MISTTTGLTLDEAFTAIEDVELQMCEDEETVVRTKLQQYGVSPKRVRQIIKMFV